MCTGLERSTLNSFNVMLLSPVAFSLFYARILCSFFLHTKTKIEEASDEKDRLLLKKMEEGDTKTHAQEKAVALSKGQEDCKEEFSQSAALMQVKVLQ